jgi:phytoene dehydrogenase-like protein
MARAGCKVLALEANPQIGGGVRSAELTLPGFTHDVCSSIYPFGLGSPFFRQLPLSRYGLEWIHPPIPLAHPLEGGQAAALHRSLAATADALAEDAATYLRIMKPLVEGWENLACEFLQPPLHVPGSPVLFARFGFYALRSGAGLANRFKGGSARALLAGLAAHSFLPLEQVPSGAIGLVLGLMAHAVGWPMPRGGAQRITNALAEHLRMLGAEIVTGHCVKSLAELPSCRAILLDVTPRQFLRMAGQRLPPGYAHSLQRFRYGPAAFKIDYALAAPIPWLAQDCARAGTVHVGGSFAEVAQSEREVAAGRPPERPFVLLAQHSVFDSTRAPAGRHTAWAYCHVPNDSKFDMTERMESQIERFAPGFRDRILARHVTTPQALEANNSNLVGGDINGGLANLRQLAARPILSFVPYRTPLRGVYLCSASTPPGGGVHGMAGYHAATAALRREFQVEAGLDASKRTASGNSR